MSPATFQSVSERFVYGLCQRTFLSLWSNANPRNAKGKELCDALVVCDPDVLLISVKDVQFNVEKSANVASERWLRAAVGESIAQLYGATRVLDAYDGPVIRQDGTAGLPFPPREQRRIHRLAVSLGSGGRVVLPEGDFGKGFVHVMDEGAFLHVMRYLDTITDLVDYLSAKEALVAMRPRLAVEGEENLLAHYLHAGRKFRDDLPHDVISDGAWRALEARGEFQRKLRADRISYLWDELVEYFGRLANARSLESTNSLSDDEETFRLMARESRFNRRILAEALVEFAKRAERRELRARSFLSPSNVGYVFMNAGPAEDRGIRRQELTLRCIVGRGRLEAEGCKTVLGICFNIERAPEGHCEDIVRVHIPEWTIEHERQAENIKRDLGFFSTPEETRRHRDEYPVDIDDPDRH